MVEETDRPVGNLVLVSISAADMDPATAAGTAGGVRRLFESDEDESDAQLGEQVEALLAKGGPLEVPTVVDNEEEEGAQDDDHSSDDDEEDGDGDEANAIRDYYADQDQPPEETLPEAPKQSALLDLLAGKKPDDVLEDPGTTQATNKTTNNPAIGKGKGPSSVTSGKAPAPKVPNNPGAPGSTDTATTTLTPAAQGVMERAQGTLFGAVNLAHVPTGEKQVVQNLENYTGLLTGLQQLVVTMAQGFQEASEDIRELVSSTLERVTERDRVFIQQAFRALGQWTQAYQAAIGEQTNLTMFDMLQRWDHVRATRNWLADKILSLTAEGTNDTTSAEIFRTLLPACFNSIRARSKAVFRTMNADLPSLLCHFVSGEQAGWMFRFTLFQTPTMPSGPYGRVCARSYLG